MDNRFKSIASILFYHHIEVYESPILSCWAIACGFGLPILALAWTWMVVVAVHQMMLWRTLDLRASPSQPFGKERVPNLDRKTSG